LFGSRARRSDPLGAPNLISSRSPFSMSVSRYFHFPLSLLVPFIQSTVTLSFDSAPVNTFPPPIYSVLGKKFLRGNSSFVLFYSLPSVSRSFVLFFASSKFFSSLLFFLLNHHLSWASICIASFLRNVGSHRLYSAPHPRRRHSP
jgi:hypothetical protein